MKQCLHCVILGATVNGLAKKRNQSLKSITDAQCLRTFAISKAYYTAAFKLEAISE